MSGKKDEIIVHQKAAGGLRQNLLKSKTKTYFNNSNQNLHKNRYLPVSTKRLENLFSDLDSEKKPLIDTGGSSYYENVDLNQNDSIEYPPLNFDDSGVGSIDVSNQKIPSIPKKPRRKISEDMEKRTSNLQTMMHILKGNIGTGILAMPSAFMNSGLFAGAIALPFLAFLATHCMHILINANRILTRRLGVGMLEYQEVAAHCISIGPRSIRRFSYLSSQMIKLFLLITQLGFCCVYSKFVAENISKFLEVSTDENVKISPLAFMGILLPLFILISFIRSLKHLSIASSLANMLQTVGLVIVLVNLVQDIPSSNKVKAYNSIEKFPLFMGTAVYAFEGIGLVLPLQKEMREPDALGGSAGVLNTGMTLVACLNVAIGFFGYLKYGDDVKASITLNLPAESMYQYCQVIFAIAIFLSYAIQYYVPFNIIWPWVKQKCQLKEETLRCTMFEYFTRAFIVIFTVAVAAIIPKLDSFISLVGAFSSSGLALIFPPLIDICVRWEEEKGATKWTWIFAKNIFILLIGFIGFTIGTYTSIDEIIKSMGHSS